MVDDLGVLGTLCTLATLLQPTSEGSHTGLTPLQLHHSTPSGVMMHLGALRTVAMVMGALLASATGAVAMCPTDYSLISNSCFLFLNEQKVGSWFEGRTVCQNNGGDLAIIKECDLFTQVVRFIHTNGLEVPARYSYWIGGSDLGDEGAWYWIDNTPMSMGVPFWGIVGNVTEPGGGIAQNCAQLYRDERYYFHDGVCDASGYPLCQAEDLPPPF